MTTIERMRYPDGHKEAVRATIVASAVRRVVDARWCLLPGPKANASPQPRQMS